ncbi:DUF4269 domain-containing protein [Acanthopleuribacter pedis]|uniref:DUF4269 domain-containing protein n=1 Tax=Acanthopleuribacter pedis TaxID=442870 RepID=A0A8J7U1N5_9BACT|nr:DUF4269 domain-containing protein [Acanthopleuribacter pedis]MBO1318393.1 DUF4269 domain-containing protein [Acanthopleuribacter pedis]
MGRDWHDITYLMNGHDRQRAAYQVLRELDVFYKLKAYKPLLAGSYPLDLEVDDSDLDVLCEAANLLDFESKLTAYYGRYPEFRCEALLDGALPTMFASLRCRGVQVEFFAQQIPVRHQVAFRHMEIEERLLRLAGYEAHRAIRVLKGQGIKTEPAFAKYFGLDGDPYQGLLDLYNKSDDALREQLPGLNVRALEEVQPPKPKRKHITDDWDDE